MPIKPKAANHQALEMPQQEIGQIERAELGLGERANTAAVAKNS